MKNCDKENAVVEAAKHGTWDEALREHVMGCESCADLALAASFLHDEASSARMEAANALPSYHAALSGNQSSLILLLDLISFHVEKCAMHKKDPHIALPCATL